MLKYSLDPISKFIEVCEVKGMRVEINMGFKNPGLTCSFVGESKNITSKYATGSELADLLLPVGQEIDWGLGLVACNYFFPFILLFEISNLN